MKDNTGFARALGSDTGPPPARCLACTVSSSPDKISMTPTELRASLSLSSIFALRMLGLFLVLPVFALEAARFPGGDDPARVGLAMGIYGLTQGALQIPFGMASDRYGRKRVIVVGLLIFALGSFLAMAASSLEMLTLGRAVQGAGAISAAVTALLADQTRDEVRTQAMTLVGVSIALMFAISLVLAPWLTAQIGLAGLFALTGVLALAAIFVVLRITPPEPAQPSHRPRGGLALVLRDPALLRLDLGVFVLHAVQLAMWVAIPTLLVQAGLAQAEHWKAYLPTVLASLVLMRGTLYPLERRGHLRAVFLGSVALIGLVQLGLLWALPEAGQAPSLVALTWLLFVFFYGFNVLEATQPSLTSRVAPVHARGAALGVFNTLQSLGFFAGGALGGWLMRAQGAHAVFLACGGLMLLWLVLAWPMRAPGRWAVAQPAGGGAAS
jgi:MFS family permease